MDRPQKLERAVKLDGDFGPLMTNISMSVDLCWEGSRDLIGLRSEHWLLPSKCQRTALKSSLTINMSGTQPSTLQLDDWSTKASAVVFGAESSSTLANL
eukprot:8606027-Heterocapsa_arctica.AAC.1